MICGLGAPEGTTTKIVDGVAFNLLDETSLAEIMMEPNAYVAPTAGARVVWGGVEVDAGHVAWVSPRPGPVTLGTWLVLEHGKGNAVWGSDGRALQAVPRIDGQPLSVTGLDAMLVSTRDLSLVGKLSAADPGSFVIFEPKDGWEKKSSAGPLVLLAAAAVVGGITYMIVKGGRR